MSDIIQFSRVVKPVSATSLGGTGVVYADIKMSDLYNGFHSHAEISPNSDALIPLNLKTAALVSPTGTPHGWSNQELSDFYRTHRLLALAGIATEIDHGLTDEGDPWCVFLDSQNEVFVHFSRFDGVYMVSSQVQEKPLQGDSLASLVTAFSESVQPATQTGNDRSSVITIAGRSRNTVMIHPAAALAALVWSIYLMSDELVAAVPPVILDSSDDLPQIDLSNAALDIETLPDLAQKAMIALINPTSSKQCVDTYHGREANVGTQIASLPSGLSMKAVGLGLSFAAVSVGLPLINPVSTGSSIETSGLNIDQLHTVVANMKAIVLSVGASIQVFQEAHEEQLVTTENSAPMAQPNIVIEKTENTVAIFKEIATSNVIVNTTSSSSQDRSATSMLTEAESASEATLPTRLYDAKVPQPAAELVSIGLLQRFDEAYDSFKLTSLSTLDMSELVQLATVNEATEVLEVLDDYLQHSQYARFDDSARMYLDFLLENYDDIKIITSSNEIIFVHVDALDLADAEHPIYSKSWSFDDGGVISTIGLQSDMDMFHLVA